MTGTGGPPPDWRTAAADLLFRVTTRQTTADAVSAAWQIPVLERWAAAGGTLRSTGPRWFVIWGNDTARMRRLHTIVLPAPWIGLTESERLAMLFAQLRQVEVQVPETPWLSRALQTARTTLHRLATQGS